MKKVILNKYYEVFNPNNNNELLATYSELESAIGMAKEKDFLAVDLVIELDDLEGESALVSGDNLFTMQIYPELIDYDNHDSTITLY